MISMKRQCPSLNNKDSHSEQDAQLNKIKNAGKKIKTHSQVKVEASPYQAIPEVPNIKLTIEQMNSDPLTIIRQLENAYAQFGAVKLTASEAWNCPFTFGFADRPLTLRVQTLQ